MMTGSFGVFSLLFSSSFFCFHLLLYLIFHSLILTFVIFLSSFSSFTSSSTSSFFPRTFHPLSSLFCNFFYLLSFRFFHHIILLFILLLHLLSLYLHPLFLLNCHLPFVLDSHPLTFYPIPPFLSPNLPLIFSLFPLLILLLLFLLLLLLLLYIRFEYDEVFFLTLASQTGNQVVSPSVFMITIKDDDSEGVRVWWSGMMGVEV